MQGKAYIKAYQGKMFALAIAAFMCSKMQHCLRVCNDSSTGGSSGTNPEGYSGDFILLRIAHPS